MGIRTRTCGPPRTSPATTSSTGTAGPARADDTIDALAVDAPGRVPHWPADRAEVTLHRILVHMTVETNRHAGHADILRELVDGAVGLHPDRAGVPEEGPGYWADHHARLERLAREVAGGDGAAVRE